MSQYYTKEQMDSLATVIGERINRVSGGGSSLENPSDISSFLAALDGMGGDSSGEPTQSMNFEMDAVSSAD